MTPCECGEAFECVCNPEYYRCEGCGHLEEQCQDCQEVSCLWCIAEEGRLDCECPVCGACILDDYGEEVVLDLC